MDKISLREAARKFNVSRPTLQKALKTGLISGERDDQGYWLVDPAELLRVYRPRKEVAKSNNQDLPAKNTVLPPDIELKIARLESDLEIEKEKRKAAEDLATARSLHILDLRRLIASPTQKALPLILRPENRVYEADK